MGTESVERRSACGQHENTLKRFEETIRELGECKKELKDGDRRMQGIEDKIDTMIERQIDYMASQAIVNNDITRIKAIVENGLRKNVDELSVAAIAVKDKMELLADFAWFIKTINNLRDGLMRKVITISLVGGIIVVLYSALAAVSSREVPKLLAKILG